MDFGAYLQIGELEGVMQRNGIEVKRLRGLRLMKNEEPIDINVVLNDVEVSACKYACESFFQMNPEWTEISSETEKLIDRYIGKDRKGDYIFVKWDKLHGKKRKLVKYLIRKRVGDLTATFGTFNKYCGRPDVLYIHAKIGGANWSYYGGKEIEKQPWFIEKVDDGNDRVYCDIYARIVPEGESQ